MMSLVLKMNFLNWTQLEEAKKLNLDKEIRTRFSKLLHILGPGLCIGLDTRAWIERLVFCLVKWIRAHYLVNIARSLGGKQ